MKLLLWKVFSIFIFFQIIINHTICPSLSEELCIILRWILHFPYKVHNLSVEKHFHLIGNQILGVKFHSSVHIFQPLTIIRKRTRCKAGKELLFLGGLLFVRNHTIIMQAYWWDENQFLKVFFVFDCVITNYVCSECVATDIKLSEYFVHLMT